jgi:hypothetical protein
MMPAMLFGPPKMKSGLPPKTSGGMEMMEHEESQEPQEQESGEGIPPEAVSFRTAEQQCGQCAYFGEGECSKLQMAVGEQDGCNLWKSGGGVEMPMSTEEDGEKAGWLKG